MKIKNCKVYGLEESIIRSGYPMQVGEPDNLKDELDITDLFPNNDLRRGIKLAKVPSGSGHDNFLKGIIVQFDLQYTQYITKQLQRYNWFDYISSQSQMHRLTHNTDVKNSCNKYTVRSSCQTVDRLIAIYNNYDFIKNGKFQYKDRVNCEYFYIESKKECFQYIISNCPMGYQLWTGVTTNYLQLKTMYNQRCKHKHKLEEWEYFGEWIKSLPMSELIIGKDE